MDNCFSIALEEDMEHYEPYDLLLPQEQVKLLQLWDFLGIPHKQLKQVWGKTLTIISFEVDPNALTVMLPADSRNKLVAQVKWFAGLRQRTLQEWQQLAGWINCLLNVFPRLCPTLPNVYDKIKGKSKQSALIFVNKSVKDNLTWFVECIETLSGMLLFVAMDWDPLRDFDTVIYSNACLKGMGFWVLDKDLGFSGETDQSSPMVHLIFFWEALTILATLHLFHLQITEEQQSNPSIPPSDLTV
ncbi:hypothetical protein BT96DRAFT_942412 [Gymnopus androsaceus JB14]|uniref:Uncharacterized protein n=1 Tax=Gymnopus androsaceus JB14 TaxID=1447944 RepID=A0A6A4HB33_9AGAR|nr:hypothetical protein BT96DRAFT_942412 [Gymnopus androsaceus JB14]